MATEVIEGDGSQVTDDALHDLIGICAGAVCTVSDDLNQLEEHGIPWPDGIKDKLAEHAGLVAALKHARSKLPKADVDECIRLFREERDNEAAILDENDGLNLPLMDDTRRAVDDALELLRRRRLLDPDLDNLVREHLPFWA